MMFRVTRLSHQVMHKSENYYDSSVAQAHNLQANHIKLYVLV